MCGLGGEEDVQQVVEELAVVHGADSLLFQVVEQEEVRELSSMINSGVRGHSGRGGQLLLTHQESGSRGENIRAQDWFSY